MDAVIGLVGVIVGALLSGGATWVLTARAEKRKARASARLLEDELVRVNRALDALLEEASRDTVTDGERREGLLESFVSERMLSGLTLDRWFEHQAILAEVLSDDSWYRVSRAYSVFPDLAHVSQVSALSKAADESPEARQGADALLQEWREMIAAGTRVLSRLAGTEMSRKGELARRGD